MVIEAALEIRGVGATVRADGTNASSGETSRTETSFKDCDCER